MRNTNAALLWLIALLNDNYIPFEIDGGFAAKLYGATRPLADIDLNIEKKDFTKLVPLIHHYITFGPGTYKDNQWELYMVSMQYAGQNFDIGALGSMKIFDKKELKWKSYGKKLSLGSVIDYEGISLNVIGKKELITYKKILNRGVDRKDLIALNND